MTVVRMLADDLTGAVDTICPFATVTERVPVFGEMAYQPLHPEASHWIRRPVSYPTKTLYP